MKKPKAEAPIHAVVCTKYQNLYEYCEDTAYPEDVGSLPVYRLGIECVCHCKDCLEILQSFQDKKN